MDIKKIVQSREYHFFQILKVEHVKGGETWFIPVLRNRIIFMRLRLRLKNFDAAPAAPAPPN
jgi:hypothetical protein